MDFAWRITENGYLQSRQMRTTTRPVIFQSGVRDRPSRGVLLQRKCGCGTAGPNGECEECRKQKLQRKSRNSEAETRKEASVPPIVHEVLHSPGRPLDPATLAFMEPRFGQDFSQVRVHTGAQAEESARAVNALAYTAGRQLVFAEAQFAPETAAGRRLLAHELAHTIQQSRPAPTLGEFRIAPQNDAAEAEAEQAAQSVVAIPSAQPAEHRRSGIAGLSPTGTLQMQSNEAGGGQPHQPLIPIPVFDELDPMVIVPDVPGVPGFLRGQKVKLSDLRSALEVLQGGLPRSSAPGTDICATLLPGHTLVKTGEFAGLCCPTMRSRERCCQPQRIGLLDFRCCSSDEVVISGHCVRPLRAPVQTPAPAQGALTPSSPTLPRLELTLPPIRFGTIRSETIDHFNVDGATVPASAAERLDHLANLIRLYPEAEVHIEGHTDTSFTAAHNQTLSENRARAVRTALISRGVPASRIIEVVGRGKTTLRFPEENTEEEKAGNRRVEVWFYTPPTRSFGERLRLGDPTPSPRTQVNP